MKLPGDPAAATRTSGRDGDLAVSMGRHRSPWFLAVVGVVAAFFFLSFVALGTWQVMRRSWKLDLIARVEQRVHAPATAAPGPVEWPSVTAASDEYRHVTATGVFLDDSQTLVQAVTDYGAGYWVLTPLRLADGSVVLVNRGFVSADDRGRLLPGAPPVGVAAGPGARASAEVGAAARAAVGPSPEGEAPAGAAVAPMVVTGLLRITEPNGGFLRRNDAATNQWYSRDVQAVAAAHGLTQVAPYFIDAEAGELPSAAESTGRVAPIPGLTAIHFHNSHLVYAITWYTLAAMVAIAIPLGLRRK